MSLKPPDTAVAASIVLSDVIEVVSDYGAAGDGSTDDTAEIQAGATAAAGKVLYLPRPSSFYKVTDDIAIPDGTVVMGDFGGTFWPEGGGRTVIKKTNANTNGSAIFTVGRDCRFVNLALEGPDTIDYRASEWPTGKNNPDYGINASVNGYGLEVENCTFRYFAAAGIAGSYEVPMVRNCKFISCLRGIDWAANDARVTDSIFRHCVHTGFRATAAMQLLTGNRFEWNARYGCEIGTGSGQVTIVGNLFDRNGSAGLYFAANTWGWVVVGNYFFRNAAGGDSVLGRLAAMTTTATDDHGNVMYLEPGASTHGVGAGANVDKAHIRIHAAKYGTLLGNRFVAGEDDAGDGARSPKYVISMQDVENLHIGPNQDELGWWQNVTDLGTQGVYREGAGSRIFTTGTATYGDLNFTGADVSLAGKLLFGTDTNLYRASANVAKTDDEFQAVGNVYGSVGVAQQAGIGSFGAGVAALALGSAADTILSRIGAAIFGLTGTLEFTEVSEPLAGSANTGRLFVKDNGASKSQLCVRFASGATQVIATEP